MFVDKKGILINMFINLRRFMLKVNVKIMVCLL